MKGYFSKLTKNGQIIIPKAIRDYFHLKPSDKIYFSVEDDKIVAKPILSIDKMFGIIKTNSVLTKAEYKETIRNAVLEKFNRKKY